ncbi:MAG: hypothetical protein VYC05_05625 [Verrucomicrobiota bacterium]|nr:hypothetical protein [Verrucomicrobiales bacterium]MEE2724840.1 hypothetical protein [Verrucomicrobiota bacterium]|tara:strand:- start:380 stop:1513 length:1134 start_codon:yes stop_codon:yes gene_type:complete
MNKILTIFLFSIQILQSSGEKAVHIGAWSQFSEVAGKPKRYLTEVPESASVKTLLLPSNAPNIIKVLVDKKVSPFEHDQKLNRIAIELDRNKKRLIEVETADNSKQLGDGRIIFSSIDAKIKGNTAKLEKNPSNYRIGFWSNLSDSIFWNYKATRWGMYDVELTYSLESKKSKIHIQIGDKSINSEIQATNSWYKYNTVRLGKIYLPKSGQYLIAVKGVEKESAAVMNFKSLVLVPTSEGKEIIQSGRNISLHSRDSKVNGVTLRYEPAQKKQCLGYWSNPSDWASWDFIVKEPGDYTVTVRQGCGRGHGGSKVSIISGTQKLIFNAEDTGGFQNWKNIDIGSIKLKEPGLNILEVRPLDKKSVAVMDIQEIILTKK